MNEFQRISGDFRGLILDGAGLLVEEWTPGAVSIILLAVFVILSLGFFSRVRAQRRALGWLRARICRFDSEQAFAEGITELDAEIASGAGKRGPRQALGMAWYEYRETMVDPSGDELPVIRNALRPSAFFNAEDLDFDQGAWRMAPGLFVSAGLFFTFAGLIAALTQIQGDLTDQALQNLLAAASAKFIMSLTGLLCSILLTIELRIGAGRVNRRIRALCEEIERRVVFHSLEEIGERQLRAVSEQREHLRLLGTELVAELARPLREELPAAIGKAIETHMGPVAQMIGKSGSDGVEQIVGNLSERISGDVGRALEQASSRLAEASDRLAGLADRLEVGSGRMGEELSAAAERMARATEAMQEAMTESASVAQGTLNQGAEQLLSVMNSTLEGIRDNTGAGARAIADAAGQMRAAAETFRAELEDAARIGADTANARMSEAATEAGGAISRAGEALAEPLSRMADKLAQSVVVVDESTHRMQVMAEAVKAGGDAVTRASDRFDGAARVLSEAASPIRVSVESIGRSTSDLARSTQAISETTQKNVETTRAALEAAADVLDQQRRGVTAAMQGLEEVLAAMRGQGDRLDDMDVKLGKAFEEYRTQVESTMQGTNARVTEIVNTLSPALDTLREVVAQAEDFAPQAHRRVS